MLVFAPAFLEWPIEMMRIMQRERPDIEIIGLATTKRVYEQLCSISELNFITLEHLEEEEYKWLDRATTRSQLKAYEERFEDFFIQRLVIADRNLGAGYLFGSGSIHTELYRLTRDKVILDRYIVNMLDYITGLYEQYKPDLFLSYAVAGSITLALGEIASDYGCKFFTAILYEDR